MATQTLKLNVKSGEKDGKNFWDRCGVLFVKLNQMWMAFRKRHAKHWFFRRKYVWSTTLIVVWGLASFPDAL